MCRAVECIRVASKDFVPGAAGEFTNQVRGTGPVAPLPKRKKAPTSEGWSPAALEPLWRGVRDSNPWPPA